SRLSR
ncbi:hypothetical protein ANME2D_01707, partial [Candidatus Methanoperedens nitroreducens]